MYRTRWGSQVLTDKTERTMTMQNDGYCGIRLVRVYKALILAALLCGVIHGSTAAAQEPARNSAAPAQAASKSDDIDQLRKMLRQLGAEVSRLKAENARLEKYRQVDYLREQLLKEEQRVESLQEGLADIGAEATRV